jgi:WD40 repeat protein
MSSVLGNYFQCRPAVVEHLGLVLCASGSLILGIDLSSGDLKFSFKGHPDIVYHINYNPLQAHKVISCSNDGSVITWDVNSRAEIARYSLNAPVHSVIVPAFTNHELTGEPDTYLVLERGQEATAEKGGNSEKLVNTNATDDYDDGSAKRFKLVVYDSVAAKNRRNICRISGPSNTVCLANFDGTEVIVAVSKRNLCIILADSRSGFKSLCALNHNMTCVTSSASRNIIVTGHQNGMILLWHEVRSWMSDQIKNLSGDRQADLVAAAAPACTSLHWHAHAVRALDTNSDGTMLYSGGEEGVLVVWQTATGLKNFVPHLGAKIAHVTAFSGSPLAVVVANNNTLRVVNTTSLLERWMTQSLCVGPFLDSSSPSDSKAVCSLQVDPVSGWLACNGYPGQLQLFEISSNTVRSVHEVVQFNRVSKTEQYTKLFVPTVSLFKFFTYKPSPSSAGSARERTVLVTVDSRRGEEFAREINLKFWEWSDQAQRYRLVTHIPRAHGEHRITSAAFRPTDIACCATAAVDGSVKLWRSASAGPNPHWACVYSFTYRYAIGVIYAHHGSRYVCVFVYVCVCVCRCIHADGLSFSSDGSLLAVAHANLISLFEPTSLALKATFVASARQQVTFTAFIEPSGSAAMNTPGSAGAAYLVVGCKKLLSLYNLLTLEVVWSVGGVFSTFGVASSDSLAFRKAGKRLSDAGADAGKSELGGWIAVCNSVQSGFAGKPQPEQKTSAKDSSGSQKSSRKSGAASSALAEDEESDDGGAGDPADAKHEVKQETRNLCVSVRQSLMFVLYVDSDLFPWRYCV